MIFDARRRVLSLPPVINGAHSALTLSTRNVFVECTATDLHKAQVVLNTVVCMFSEYCAAPFTIEPVDVTDAFGETRTYPDLSPKEFSVASSFVNNFVGVNLSAERQADLLTRMQLEATVVPGTEQIHVRVPPTRSDILHPVDVAEDVAIAFGFNNIARSVPPTVTVAKELPLNQLTELLRIECASAGYTEILTWALCSRLENFDFMRRKVRQGPHLARALCSGCCSGSVACRCRKCKCLCSMHEGSASPQCCGGPDASLPLALDCPQDDGKTAVSIGNPATSEFQIVRTHLLPAALKTLGANKSAPIPVKFFEISGDGLGAAVPALMRESVQCLLVLR